MQLVSKIHQLLTPEEKSAAVELAEKSDDEKTFFLYCMMKELRWHRGVTTHELSVLWGDTPKHLGNLAQRARFLLVTQQSSEFKSPDDLRFELKAVAESLLHKALNAKRPMVLRDSEGNSHIEYADDPDVKAALMAVRQISEMFGLGTKRLIPQANQELEEMGADELMALAREALEARREAIEVEGESDAKSEEAEEIPSVVPGVFRGEREDGGALRGGSERREGDPSGARRRRTDRANPEPGAHPDSALRTRRPPQRRDSDDGG